MAASFPNDHGFEINEGPWNCIFFQEHAKKLARRCNNRRRETLELHLLRRACRAVSLRCLFPRTWLHPAPLVAAAPVRSNAKGQRTHESVQTCWCPGWSAARCFQRAIAPPSCFFYEPANLQRLGARSHGASPEETLHRLLFLPPFQSSMPLQPQETFSSVSSWRPEHYWIRSDKSFFWVVPRNINFTFRIISCPPLHMNTLLVGILRVMCVRLPLQ